MRPFAVLCTPAVAVVAAFVAGACAEPYYDSDIGVEGVAVDEGSLAGTFAVESLATDQAEVPVFGKIDTGGVTFTLVQRTWRADEPAIYDEVITVCDVENFETAGLTTVNSRGAIDAIPAIASSLEVDHAAGSFLRHTFREFWAVRNLDDDDAFPTDVDDPVFYDSDDDGNPGATVVASGLASGEVYVAQRKTVDHKGVVRGPDESFGLAKVKKEGIVLDATSDTLKTESPRTPHPDPKRSWWYELRLPDDGDCSAVRAARDNEDLPLGAPFER
ncbi:MAG TPA: hypothetical protein VGF99_08550 [Myxococcota bacterium]